MTAKCHCETCKAVNESVRIGYRYEPAKVPTSREEAFLAAVLVELKRARTKHPGGKHLCVALTEEVGELAKAHLDEEGQDRIWDEAVQVAVVALRIAVESDEDFAGGEKGSKR